MQFPWVSSSLVLSSLFGRLPTNLYFLSLYSIFLNVTILCLFLRKWRPCSITCRLFILFETELYVHCRRPPKRIFTCNGGDCFLLPSLKCPYIIILWYVPDYWCCCLSLDSMNASQRTWCLMIFEKPKPVSLISFPFRSLPVSCCPSFTSRLSRLLMNSCVRHHFYIG